MDPEQRAVNDAVAPVMAAFATNWQALANVAAISFGGISLSCPQSTAAHMLNRCLATPPPTITSSTLLIS